MVFSGRFRSRSQASDLTDACWIVWKFRMRPAGMKRPLALSTAFLMVFSACSTVVVSMSKVFSQASALCIQSALFKLMLVLRGPSIEDSSEMMVMRMDR